MRSLAGSLADGVLVVLFQLHGAGSVLFKYYSHPPQLCIILNT